MFDAKKTAEELEKIFFSPAIVSARHTMSSVEKIVCEIYAEGRKQMREAAAKVARERAEHHRGYCPTTCRCADGWHIAAAIESLPLEPQPLETKGTDNA